jgi:hypothetical protein
MTDCANSWDRECSGCGTHVSQDYARVFSDNSGTLHRCHSCVDRDYLRGASGAGPNGSGRSSNKWQLVDDGENND